MLIVKINSIDKSEEKYKSPQIPPPTDNAVTFWGTASQTFLYAFTFT